MCPLDRVRREKYKGFEGKVREEVWVDENGLSEVRKWDEGSSG